MILSFIFVDYPNLVSRTALMDIGFRLYPEINQKGYN